MDITYIPTACGFVYIALGAGLGGAQHRSSWQLRVFISALANCGIAISMEDGDT
ncbi:hypothetical protein [Bradyrhizobium sp. WSM471]|uniref:hypothetical protein n=1 Tax=Bradyrhizobium sp. WSM471 TaxID=319017 RepID=UPI0012FBEF19|nr:MULTISPECIES: hypothetical protein [Bradyrhizobium]UFW42940.1 hypothetical protein BcanWSM471_07235 [Bradyrhizobium canariense]